MTGLNGLRSLSQLYGRKARQLTALLQRDLFIKQEIQKIVLSGTKQDLTILAEFETGGTEYKEAYIQLEKAKLTILKLQGKLQILSGKSEMSAHYAINQANEKIPKLEEKLKKIRDINPFWKFKVEQQYNSLLERYKNLSQETDQAVIDAEKTLHRYGIRHKNSDGKTWKYPTPKAVHLPHLSRQQFFTQTLTRPTSVQSITDILSRQADELVPVMPGPKMDKETTKINDELARTEEELKRGWSL